MLEVKKTNEVLDLDKMIGLEQPSVFDLDQIKDAQISMGKLVQSMTVPIGEIQKLQALVTPSASVMRGIEQLGALAVSVEDTRKAFMDAFAPTTEAMEMIGKMFKKHAEEFQRVADIGNIIGERWVKIIEETNTQTSWQEGIAQLQAETVTHMPALRQEYRAIVDDLPLSLTFTLPKVKATYKTELAPTRLSEEDKEDIATRAANKVLAVMVEKYEAIQLTRNEFTAGVIVETHEIADAQLRWENLVMDLNRATLQYKDFQEIDIPIGTQAIKLLACLMRKGGEVVEYSEIAIAIGHRGENQRKKNKAVDRYVQGVKQKMIFFLEKAGMTHAEINQMIVTQEGIGFVLRKISVT